MKHEIIYTKHYALIISDENIKDVCKNFLEDDLKTNTLPIYSNTLGESKKIIAYRPLKDAPIIEGVPLLPEFDESDKVEKLAYNWFVTADKKNTIFDLGWVNIFTAGYNKAKETYRFSEDDLIECILFGMKKGLSVGKIPETDNDWVNNYVKSLQQPKRPKYFECEVEDTFLLKKRKGGNTIMVKPKTVINSQGQIELVGEYIYE
jgi:hypothetical protein